MDRTNWRAWHLVNTWRMIHPTSEFSFFSPVHQVHTRIDMFLASTHITTRIHHTEFLARTYSDHCPLLLILNWGPPRARVPTWRLQCAALEDAVYRTTIQEAIDTYFNTNTGTASNALIEWDAFKVYIRGICIKTTTGVRATLRSQLHTLEQRLKELEISAVTSPPDRALLIQHRRSHADRSESVV